MTYKTVRRMHAVEDDVGYLSGFYGRLLQQTTHPRPLYLITAVHCFISHFSLKLLSYCVSHFCSPPHFPPNTHTHTHTPTAATAHQGRTRLLVSLAALEVEEQHIIMKWRWHYAHQELWMSLRAPAPVSTKRGPCAGRMGWYEMENAGTGRKVTQSKSVPHQSAFTPITLILNLHTHLFSALRYTDYRHHQSQLTLVSSNLLYWLLRQPSPSWLTSGHGKTLLIESLLFKLMIFPECIATVNK